MDVCLVSMPQAPIQTPSTALGLLKAVLRRDGIKAKVFHAQLWFLEFIEPSDYVQLQAVRTADAVFDWLFAEIAFPDFRPAPNLYLDRMLERSFDLGGRDPAEARAQFLEIRTKIPGFVEEAAERVLAFDPRIVGCTSSFQQHTASLALLRRIREVRPDVLTLMGGPNCEAMMGRATHENFPWVDYVVSGEADGCISGLCRTLMNAGREARPEDLPEGVFGPAHRRLGYPRSAAGDGLPAAVTPSLENLPMPDYDDYFEALDRFPMKNLVVPSLPVESSRGCWWRRCDFCGLNGCARTFRSKPANRVLEEIEGLIERHGTTRITLTDNVLDVAHFDSLLPLLAASEKGPRIFCEIRPDLDRGQVEQLASAGVRCVIVGIESLQSEVLGLIHKGVSAWENIQCLKWLRQSGIVAGWNYLFGFPGEKDEWYGEVAAWMPLLFHLSPCRFVFVKYCRFSNYFTQAGEYGLRLIPQGLPHLIYPLTAAEQKNIAYHFEDENTPDYFDCLGAMSFPGRPGLEAVHRETLKWRMASGNNPILVMRESAGVIEVRDTRPCAVKATHRIEGTARLVLERCDDAPVVSQLLSGLVRDGIPEADAREALRDLVDRKLVLEIDGRAISLPLREPLPELPKTSANPCGLFLPEEFQKDDLSLKTLRELSRESR